MRQSVTAHLTLAAAEDTERVGAALGRVLSRSAAGPLVLGLRGPLGAGKTTLARSALQALGVKGAIRSPTYTLIEPYELPHRSVQHLDLYRLVDPREAEALGLRDLLTDGVVMLIEWPEKGGDVIPQPDIDFDLGYLPGSTAGRSLRLEANSSNGAAVLQALIAEAAQL